jgi:hypothetical protein
MHFDRSEPTILHSRRLRYFRPVSVSLRIAGPPLRMRLYRSLALTFNRLGFSLYKYLLEVMLVVMSWLVLVGVQRRRSEADRGRLKLVLRRSEGGSESDKPNPSSNVETATRKYLNVLMRRQKYDRACILIDKTLATMHPKQREGGAFMTELRTLRITLNAKAMLQKHLVPSCVLEDVSIGDLESEVMEIELEEEKSVGAKTRNITATGYICNDENSRNRHRPYPEPSIQRKCGKSNTIEPAKGSKNHGEFSIKVDAKLFNFR